MYFSRTGSFLDILLFLIQCSGWTVGGWLLVTHAFRLRSQERLLTGFATGWLLWIVLGNLLVHILPLSTALWLATAIILAAGLILAWRSSQHPRVEFRDWLSWPQLALVLGITVLFLLIQRGLAIFDDYLHMPLTSIMGAGDIPPHFYVDPSVYFAYHYALHILAAGLERVAGLFPWSAWDLSKSFAIALTLGIGWLWVLRMTRSGLAGILGSFLITFGGGARWLLLFIPMRWLLTISANVSLINTGVATAINLATALVSPWPTQGSAPIPFPFAFHNGIFVPVFFILGNDGALSFAAVLLLLLLVSRRTFSISGILIMSLILSSLALSAEHVYAALWIGIVISVGLYFVRTMRRSQTAVKPVLWQWAGILSISALVSILQGGVITEVARGLLSKIQGAAAVNSMNYYGFLLRWPPAFPDGHFAPLSIFNPSQLIVLLAELGPSLLLLPLVIWFIWHRNPRQDWLRTGLGIAAVLSFLLPFFFEYGIDRQTTRVLATSLWLCLVLSFPILWSVFRLARQFLRAVLGLAYMCIVFSGIVIFAIQLTAIPNTQLSYFIFRPDAEMSSLYWDRLEPHAQVLDSFPERAITVFGRASRARQDIYQTYPEWETLIASPDPAAINRAGYSYVYMDPAWWGKLTPSQQAAFNLACVSLLHEVKAGGDFRILYDVRQCK